MLESECLKSNDNKLKQTARQIAVLSHILPYLVGHKVTKNDLKWIIYIRLLQIQQLVTSPTVTVETQISLSTLIVRHNSNFLELFPNESFLPKIYYLVHLNTQMKEFGPLQNHSCLRID